MKYHIKHTADWLWCVYTLDGDKPHYFDNHREALDYQSDMNRLAYLNRESRKESDQ